MKKTAAILLLLCLTMLMSCNTKLSPPPLGGGDDECDDSIKETVVIPLRMSGDSVKPNNELKEIYDIWSYIPQVVTVPAQSTIERAVCSLCPNMRKCYNYDYIGGIKLIGEMSADRAGYNYSYYSGPISFNILSPSQLHLGWITSRNNVVCLALEGKVKIESAIIISRSVGMGIEVEVKNTSQMYQEVEFEQGQMVEVKEPHVQNVVIISKAKAQLNPNETWHFTLPVLCAAHYRSSPVGYAARITPYVMNASAATFQSQQSVWNFLESNDDPDSYVTFYVWGKGTVTASGKRSPTGHAFVRIPKVGVVGFSTLNGGLLNDEGVIYDHTSSIQYATDSCRIKVSDNAKKAMIKKLHQLQQNVPKYRIGHYDCTSFVMDLADAGGIHYGTRITIQTPVGFMQELKKHNYSN